MRQSTASAALSLLLCLTQGSAHGQALAQPAVNRSQGAVSSEEAEGDGRRIDREREALRSTLLREQQACRQGFWVNACLNEAQARYRQALKPLQQQQQALEQARRQEIGEQARQRVQDKQEAQEQRKARADGSSSESAETDARMQSSEVARQAQARERVLKQQQREAAAEQRLRERVDAAAPAPDAAPQAEKPVR